eukprot:jgi/Chlat1/877/Chrsp107S00038
MADAGAHVRYAALSRLSDGVAVASWTHTTADPECADTVSRVVSSGNLRSNSKLTVTVNDRIGSVHIQADGADVLAVVTAQSYRRDIAWKLLQELREQVRSSVTSGDVSSAFSESLSKRLGPGFEQVCARYNDPAQVDPLSRANAQVEEVRVQVLKNIDQLTKNIESMEVIESKAEGLKTHAEGFRGVTRQVRRKYWWKMQKMRIFVCLLVIIILAAIIIPVVLHFTK